MGIPLVADPGYVTGMTDQRRLFDQYKDRVFSIALNFLRGDAAAAHDVSQEVFVKVFRGWDSFRGEAKISTWIYRIVSNVCLDELRRRRRMVLFGDMPAPLQGIVPAVEPRELDPDVTSALRRLSPRLRMAVLLRYFDDLSYDEIADALGVSSGTVASRLNRAHKLLARELAHLNPRGPLTEGNAS